MLLIAAGAASILIAGCRTGDAAAAAAPAALGVDADGYRIERHRGQIVRVCGRPAQFDGRPAIEHIRRPGETFFHGPPTVLLVPCGGAAPRLDRDGCITGRVAALDGSMNPPPRTLHDDRPVSPDWFLHLQCPARR
jgi:hypothetical protein